MPSGRCVPCTSVKYKNQYALGQWSRDDGLRACSLCLEGKKSVDTPWQRVERGLWKGQGAFHASQHRSSLLTARRCVDCHERRRRRACEVRKYEAAFAQFQWDLAGNSRCKGGTCTECEELKKRLTRGLCKVAGLATHSALRDVDDEERLCGDKCERTENNTHKQRAKEVEPKVCSRCGEPKPRESHFDSMREERPRPRARIECVERGAAKRDAEHRNISKMCAACGEEKSEVAFSRHRWLGAASLDRAKTDGTRS